VAAAAAPDPYPFAADVLRATRPRQWWRIAHPHYARIAALCLAYYRKRGWPITRDPTEAEISLAWIDDEGRGHTGTDARLVSYRLRTVSRFAKQRVTFAMALDNARAEFETQKGVRAGADYAGRAQQ
jgi:hypothetical protein